MKKKRYTTEQMISILKECEATGNISEVCRKHDRGDDVLQLEGQVRRDAGSGCQTTEGAGERRTRSSRSC